MNASAQFGTYVAILRKHLVLLLVSSSVVVLAGILYLINQEPVYRATLTLTIQRPERAVVNQAGVRDFMNIDRRGLNTEFMILKKNQELGRRTIERLKADGIDTAAAGYSAGSLTADLLIEPIPDTHGFAFSLDGTDRASLHQAVNIYAEEYRRYSQGTSAQRFRLQEEELERSRTASEAATNAASEALLEFRRDNGSVNFASGENPYTEERRKLSDAVWRGSEETYRLTTLRDSIRRELEHVGVTVVENEFELRLPARQPDGTELHGLLADAGGIAALEPVKRSLEVRQFASELRSHRDRLSEMRKSRTVAADAPEYKATERRIEELRGYLGEEVRYVLETQLRTIAERVRFQQRQQEQLDSARQSEERVLDIFQKNAALGATLARAERELASAESALENLRSAYLPGVGLEEETRGPSWQIDIVQPATAGGLVQVAPKKSLIIGLTAFSALAVGLGLVFLFEFFDDTIKSREDFDRYIGLPFLGFIPHISSKEVENPDRAADARPGSAIAEAFRTLRTSILFSRPDSTVHSILVTSAGPGEGKTTVAVNLAATLAKQKAPVLLIDCDLRKPRVAKALGMDNKRGLTNYLIGEATLDELVQETGIEGLYALTSGPIPPNPAELLHREPMRKLLEETAAKYDKVVIDSPPVIAVTDARVLASWTDGLYLVVSMGKTSRRLIQRAVESVTSIGFKVHGAILNNLSMPTGRYGYYYYRDYAYGRGYYREGKDEAKGDVKGDVKGAAKPLPKDASKT